MSGASPLVVGAFKKIHFTQMHPTTATDSFRNSCVPVLVSFYKILRADSANDSRKGMKFRFRIVGGAET